MFGFSFRNALVYLLILSFVTSSVSPVFAESNDTPVNPEDAEKTKLADEFLENVDVLMEEVASLVDFMKQSLPELKKKAGERRFEELQDKFERHKRRSTKWGQPIDYSLQPDPNLKNKYGEEDFWIRVKNGHIQPFKIETPTGIIEPTLNGKGNVIWKVVDRKGFKWLVIDEGFKVDEQHLEQLVSRIHLSANDGKGRNVFIWRKNSDPEYRPIEKTWSGYLRDFKNSVWVTPGQGGEAMVTTFCVTAQVTISCGIGKLHQLSNGGEMDYKGAALSAIFGTVVGIFARSYKNIINLDDVHWKQVVRGMPLSVSFAYILQIWRAGVGSLSLFDSAGLLTHASLLSNVLINNWVKNWWKEFSRIHEETGGREYFEFRNPFTGKMVPTQIKESMVVWQALELGSYTFKMLDLLSFKLTLPILGKIAAGKLAMWSTLLIIPWAVVKFAESREYEGTEDLRNKFHNLIYGRHIVNATKTVGSFGKKFVTEHIPNGVNGIINHCKWALGLSNEEQTP